MSDTKKLLRDIQTLRDSIQRDWMGLEGLPLTRAERIQIRANIKIATKDLEWLLKRAWLAEDGDPPN